MSDKKELSIEERAFKHAEESYDLIPTLKYKAEIVSFQHGNELGYIKGTNDQIAINKAELEKKDKEIEKVTKERDEAIEGLRLQLLFSDEWGERIESFSDELSEKDKQLAAQSKLLEEMQKAYATYLEFLEGHYADKATFAMVHGVRDSEVSIKRGVELRDVIERVLEAYETLKGKT